MPVNAIIKVYRGTAAALASENRVLYLAEPAIETDANKLKFGDGATAYNSLPYFGAATWQPLDSDLSDIAALITTSFGRGGLTQADGPAFRSYIGAGTSSFSGVYSSLSGIPSTFAPSAHASSHAAAGGDPLTLSESQITNLVSDLAARQPLAAALTALAAGSDFVQFTGPTTSVKTYALPNSSAVILTDNAAVTVPQGGTGVSSLTAYAPVFGGTTSTGAVQSGAVGSSGQVLASNGAGTIATFQGLYSLLASVATGRSPGTVQVLTASAGNALVWVDVDEC